MRTSGEAFGTFPPTSVGIDKVGARWESAILLGVRDLSGEICMGTSEGILKARAVRRYRTTGDKRDAVALGLMKGTPWEPTPRRECIEVASRVALPPVPAEVPPAKEFTDKEKAWRRPRIEKQDATRFGITVGCPRCVAAARGIRGGTTPTHAGTG